MCTAFCPCNFDVTNTEIILHANQTYITGPATKIQNCDSCYNIEYVGETVEAILLSWIYRFLKLELTVPTCSIPDDYYTDVYMKTYKQYIPLLKFLEERFDCSGICIPANTFLFSDINKGKPIGNCREKVWDWSSWITLNFALITLFFGLFQVRIM